MRKPRLGGVFLCSKTEDKKIGRAYGNSANVMCEWNYGDSRNHNIHHAL